MCLRALPKPPTMAIMARCPSLGPQLGLMVIELSQLRKRPPRSQPVNRETGICPAHIEGLQASPHVELLRPHNSCQVGPQFSSRSPLKHCSDMHHHLCVGFQAQRGRQALVLSSSILSPAPRTQQVLNICRRKEGGQASGLQGAQLENHGLHPASSPSTDVSPEVQAVGVRDVAHIPHRSWLDRGAPGEKACKSPRTRVRSPAPPLPFNGSDPEQAGTLLRDTPSCPSANRGAHASSLPPPMNPGGASSLLQR